MFIYAAEPLLLHACIIQLGKQAKSLVCQKINLVAIKLTTELAKIFLLPCITSMYADLLNAPNVCSSCFLQNSWQAIDDNSS